MTDNLKNPAQPRPFTYDPPQTPWLDVIYHDADILVLNKQAGLLTVAGKTNDLADCLEARAAAQFEGARIVHRLDKDTSGVIVLGLTAAAHANLGLQFENRQTRKTYIARIWGHPEAQSGKIDEPIMTDWPNRPKQQIDYERGRNAITHWQVLEREVTATRVELTPETGRTHQLRVHMLHLGHPILGDNLYASDEILNAATTLQLHAQNLSFIHPSTSDTMNVEAPCPF